ncbi:MAG: HD domain-containing phosphohydrolase [Candidatus Aminicenantaceae bacterium]
MKIEKAFLRSKVARRIFVLFILCALLPITILAIITYSSMTKQLQQQTRRELQQTSKSMGMAIFERLVLIESEMRMVSSNLDLSTEVNGPQTVQIDRSSLNNRFKGLVLLTHEGQSINLFGQISDPPVLDFTDKQKIFSGETLILTKPFSNDQSRIFMCSAFDPQDEKKGMTLAEIDPMYLWFMGYENPLPPATALSILDSQASVLFSSFGEGIELPKSVMFQMQSSSAGQFEWDYREERYLASFWSLFLMSKFFSPDWSVIIFKSKTSMLAPLANFKNTFPWIILITLWVVLFLSVNQIRKSMIPLEKLKEGTQRIAQRDFDSHIEVRSQDEFADLANSFNTMASHLGRQFKTLTAMVDIDRAILAALETKKIVEVINTHMRQVFPCDAVSISLLDPNSEQSVQTYVHSGNPHQEEHTESIKIECEEIRTLHNNPDHLFIPEEKSVPNYLAPLMAKNIRSFLILPLFIKNSLSGIITLGYSHSPDLLEEDISQARQLADQVAVALSNVRLIEELNQFNLGSLTAFARAIDAKSSWTAGHSERVTIIALKIGKTLGLSPEDLDILHRGGLLHDIGKIGVAYDVLDKPGKLNPEERKDIQKHVILGARILEPIPAYSEILPIVKQHHENFDGTGYTEGIAGNDICLYARILALADRFEAVTSDRPYRKAWSQNKAIEFVKKQAGKEFDPEVVKAFLEVVT